MNDYQISVKSHRIDLHRPVFYQIRIGDENVKDTLVIPLELGLRKRAGIDGWFFGRTLNAFYIKFVKP